MVAFSGGVAAFYRSGLFIAKPFDMGSMKAWTQPLFVAAMILVGGYQFYRARNKSNTGKLSKGGGDVSQMLNQLPAHLRGEVRVTQLNDFYGLRIIALLSCCPHFHMRVCYSLAPCLWHADRGGAVQFKLWHVGTAGRRRRRHWWIS